MTKVIYESHTTLFPRLDQDHSATAGDIVHEFINDYPEYKNNKLILNVEMSVSRNTGIAHLHITVSDPAAMSRKELVFYIAIVLFGIYAMFVGF